MVGGDAVCDWGGGGAGPNTGGVGWCAVNVGVEEGPELELVPKGEPEDEGWPVPLKGLLETLVNPILSRAEPEEPLFASNGL